MDWLDLLAVQGTLKSLLQHHSSKSPVDICTQHRSTAICKTNANKYDGEINNNTIIVENFNTPPTPMDRSTKQKINKTTQTLNDTIDQLDLTGIYRTFHPKTMNFTIFSSEHRMFSRIGHILGHKSSLGKLKKKLKSFQASFLTTRQ